jgi:hypothetical protein
MVLTALASPGSAPLSSVQFGVDGMPVGPLVTNEPFTVSFDDWSIGTHSVCAVVTDAFGAVVFSPSNVVTVVPVQASALFRQFDFAPRGNWPGVYGSQGYSMARISTQLPPYAPVQRSEDAWLPWAALTSDPRALHLPNSSLRSAGAWYSFTNFTLDINLLDGETHRIALYCLDWDRAGGNQIISVLDAVTAQVLDIRSLVGFSNGVYAVWDISGHVQFNLTRHPLFLPAVLSGVFVDPPLDTPTVRMLSPTNASRTA